MKNHLKKLLKAASLLVLCVFVLQSCSKDDNPIDNGGPIKVTYRVIGSEGVNITTVVYQAGGSNQNTATGEFGNSWTSPEVEVTGTPIIVANATGPNGQSTLRTEILVNGQVISEGGLSTGTALSSTATYRRN